MNLLKLKVRFTESHGLNTECTLIPINLNRSSVFPFNLPITNNSYPSFKSMAKNAAHILIGQKLILTPGRALFWKNQKILILADPHFGKAQTFREHGIPVPSGTTSNDLHRLTRLLEAFNARKLLILGDLTHDKIDSPGEFNRLIDRWRNRHSSLELLMASGNHDRRSDGPPAPFRVDHVAKNIKFDPFVFSHEPKPMGTEYIIAGHIHPGVCLKGKGRLKENLPCFYFGSRYAILPAFGSFTGNQTVRPTREDRVYVIAGDEVLEVKRSV